MKRYLTRYHDGSSDYYYADGVVVDTEEAYVSFWRREGDDETRKLVRWVNSSIVREVCCLGEAENGKMEEE